MIIETTIRHGQLTRILRTAASNYSYPSFFEYIRMHPDGSAEATNGKIFVSVLDHHTPFENQYNKPLSVHINKKTDIPVTKEVGANVPAEFLGINEPLPQKKHLTWGTQIAFNVSEDTRGIDTPTRYFPKYDRNFVPSLLTCFNPYDKMITTCVQEVMRTSERFPELLKNKHPLASEIPVVWSGETDLPGVLLHDISGLLVIGMPYKVNRLRERHAWEKTGAWETYKRIWPLIPDKS